MEATLSQPEVESSSPGETDHLAAAVLRTLGRSHRNMFSLSPSQAFWMSVVSFGLWPVWRMGKQFRGYVTFERQQLWHLAEWLRLRRGGEGAIALQDQLKTIQPNLRAKRFVTVCLTGVMVLIWMMLGHEMSMNGLIDSTWRLHRSWSSLSHLSAIWLIWVAGLGVAYAIHACMVMRHHRAVSGFVTRLNDLLRHEGVATVSMPAACIQVHEIPSGWWWTAGILTWFGGLWAIPMGIGGAMQRRYINSTSARMRTDMLESVRAIIQQRRPAVAVPSFINHARRCGNERCRATLRSGAGFCSRCGTSAERMSEVA